MTVRVRFAPSPTGNMHIGHIRAALPNYLFALREKGTFIVRMEDTDLERHVEEAEAQMLADLEWLGMHADESPLHGGDFGPYRTRERAKRGDYEDAVKKLMDAGRAYECFVTEQELDVMRKLQRQRNEPPRYDNRHRDLTEEKKAEFRAKGMEPVIRFKLEDGDIEFEDMVRGTVKFEAQHLGGDPVIVRSNGIPLFTLAGCVDDINQKITHVVRGEDHVANTAMQVQIFKALGATPPMFAHVPMLLDAEGHKFSKRKGSLSVVALRNKGYVPQAIMAYMASLGFSFGTEPRTLEELAKLYDLTTMSRSAARFDEEQLTRTNATYLHSLNLADIEDQLKTVMPEFDLDGDQAATFWKAVRENIETLADVKELYTICFGNIQGRVEKDDADFIKEALGFLPSGPFDTSTWGQWTGALKEQTGRKGKALFMPLRLALTGQSHGPDLSLLLPVMGEEKTKQRLESSLS